MLLSLTGCKGKNKNKKGDVVNDLVLKANTKEVTKYLYSDFNLQTATLPVSNIDKINTQPGFLEIIDTSGKTYFYSLIKGSVIASETIGVRDISAFYGSSLAGGYLRITKNGITNVYDALGNTLIKDAENVTSLTITDDNSIDNVTMMAKVQVNLNIIRYFKYDSNGTASQYLIVDGASEAGSSMQGIQYSSLDNYGHQGYKIYSSSSRYVVFDNNNNEVASFTDPNADVEFFVGDYLIYQNSIKLDDNNNNYDYISTSGERFSLETYRINYLTAKKEAVKSKFVLASGVKPFFNDKGVYTYCYGNLQTISDKKNLSSTVETYIIDTNGVLHDNVTGIDLGAFKRFGNNYYNESSKTIYDGYLNEISILGDMSPEYVENAELIICHTSGNSYGAINHEGKVAIPFEYEMIFTNYISDSNLLAMKNGKLCKISFNARECASSVVKEFSGYTTIDYLLNDNNKGGAAIYKISGSATATHAYPDYLSLSANNPVNIQTNLTSEMEVRLNTANAIDRCAFTTLEKVGYNYIFRTSPISISH